VSAGRDVEGLRGMAMSTSAFILFVMKSMKVKVNFCT
jgi:hypothetical protein